MKRTKLVTAIAALPLAAALLAGCGGGDENPTPEPTVTTQAPQVQGRGGSASDNGGADTTPDVVAGEDGTININTDPAAEAGAPTTSTDTPPSNLGENTGAESNYGGTNNPKCEGVGNPIPKGGEGYNEERDLDKDGIACEPNDGGIGAPSETPAPVDDGADPVTEVGTAPSDSSAPSGPLGVADGTTIWAVTTQETKIYASPDTSSQALGTAVNGASFKGTVTADGKWVKIDRSAGYIQASTVKVDRQL